MKLPNFLRLMIASLAIIPSVNAATFNVTTFSDNVDSLDGLLSLREAIIQANGTPGNDSIMLPAGDFRLTLLGANDDTAATGDLDILENLNIIGAGADQTILTVALAERAFHLHGGTSTLSGMSVRGTTPVSGDGGALLVESTAFQAVINDCEFSGHTADRGGAIAALGNSIINLNRSTIAECSADSAGGLYIEGTLNARHSTIARHAATDGHGGGIFMGPTSSGFLHRCTVVSSTSHLTSGPGLWLETGANVRARASIFMGNGIIGPNIIADISGTLDSASDYNIIQSSVATGGLIHGVNQNQLGLNQADVMDYELAYNSGPVRTYCLSFSSPAIDAGLNAVGNGLPDFTTDQRGLPSPLDFPVAMNAIGGDGSDIGAVEMQSLGGDWGDAPDSYGTTAANNGASHDAGGPILGSAREYEEDGHPDARADAAYVAPSYRDDDGAAGSGTIAPGAILTFTVTTTSAIGGELDYFFDWDNDGTFGNIAGETYSATLVGGSNTIIVTVPTWANAAGYFARFRISTAGGLGPNGNAPDGEVEDYLFGTNPTQLLDFGDAPDSYGTLLASNGPRHRNVDLALGTFRSEEPNAEAPLDGTGDGGEEDGVIIPPILAGATSASISVTSTHAGQLDFWFDWDGDGTFANNANETYSQAVNAGANTINVSVPASYQGVPTYARFRLSSQGGLSPHGFATDGEVEDHVVNQPVGWDFGDAPDTYGTTLANDGARHYAVGPYIGSSRDTEPDAMLPLDGTGDGFDDNVMTIGARTLNFTASEAAQLDYFIDWDGNGIFGNDPNEIHSTSVSAGPNSINLGIPISYHNWGLYIRMRISSTGGLGPTGPAFDGEVEDVYLIGTDAQIYVDAETGNDSYLGTQVYPVATIGRGAALLRQGGTIHVGPGVYQPASAVGDVTIEGAGIGVTIIDGENERLCFATTPYLPSAGNLTFKKMTLRNGDSGGGPSTIGGVSAFRDLTMVECEIVNCAGGVIVGGAGFFDSCLFAGNIGGIYKGGAIRSYTGDLTVVNCTFSDNGLTGVGAQGAAIYGEGNVSIKHSTFTSNWGAPAIEGIGQIVLTSCLVAGNAHGDISNIDTAASQYNLIGTGGLSITDILDVNLQDNGGTSRTHGLVIGSPAIDSGEPGITPGPNVPFFDQRGSSFPRFLNGRVDIGAFEGTVVPSAKLNTVYVNASLGNDSNSGASVIAAKKSIAAALGTVAEDGIVVLGAGTYAGGVQIPAAPGDASRVRFFGANPGTTIIDGQSFDHCIEILHQDAEVKLYDLTLTGSQVTGIQSVGNLEVNRCVITNHDRRGIRQSSGTLRLSSSEISSCQQSGLACINVLDVTIGQCTFRANYSGDQLYGGAAWFRQSNVTVNDTLIDSNTSETDGSGISCFASDITMINSTIYGGTYSGVYVSGSGQFDARHCTIAHNGGGIHVQPNGICKLTNTIVAGNTSHDISGEPLDPNSAYNLIGDPASAGGLQGLGNIIGNGSGSALPIASVIHTTLGNHGGFTKSLPLVPSSPGLDGGDPAFSAARNDQRGTGYPRVQNGRVDIGAIEGAVATTNTAPVALGFAPITVASSQGFIKVNLSTGFSDSEDAILSYRILSDSDPYLVGSKVVTGNALRLVPRLNLLGTTTLVIRATDPAGLIASTTLKITVTGGAWQQWQNAHFHPELLSQIELENMWNVNADPDGDGLPNAGEAYHNYDPNVLNGDPFTLSYQDGPTLDYVFRWELPAQQNGVLAMPVWSTDLQTFYASEEGGSLAKTITMTSIENTKSADEIEARVLKVKDQRLFGMLVYVTE